jgi:large subunit ribosomal protein L5
MQPRLEEKYHNEVVPALLKEFSLSNVMQVPRLTKITVNIGVGEAVRDIKLIDSAVKELTVITGQHPIVTRARRSIATFKLREGMPIGVKVTLRRDRMWEFLDRLLNVALPRVRDFRGLPPKAFDGKGNYSMGVKEQIIFPEIDYDDIDRIRGLNVSLSTTASNDKQALAMFTLLGFPFRK